MQSNEVERYVPPLVCGQATPAAGALSQHLFGVLRDSKQVRERHTVTQTSTGTLLNRCYGDVLRQGSTWTISPHLITPLSRCYQGTFVLCCASTSAAAHGPQPEGSGTQQRHKGPGWEFLVSYFCCQESTLMSKCWVHLGGQQRSCQIMRDRGGGEEMLKEVHAMPLCKSLVLSGLGFLLLLQVGSSVAVAFLWWPQGSAWLVMSCSCWCAQDSGLKQGAAQLGQCNTILERLSCPSQPSSSAVPC